MDSFKVLVCGGRDFNDWELLRWTLKSTITDPAHGGKIWPYEIISGMAKGADRMAADFAVQEDLILHPFPADWKKYGKAAGYIRNKQMLEEGKPDLVVAFPGGKGTAMMVKIAREAGVPVEEIQIGS